MRGQSPCLVKAPVECNYSPSPYTLFCCLITWLLCVIYRVSALLSDEKPTYTHLRNRYLLLVMAQSTLSGRRHNPRVFLVDSRYLGPEFSSTQEYLRKFPTYPLPIYGSITGPPPGASDPRCQCLSAICVVPLHPNTRSPSTGPFLLNCRFLTAW